MRMYTKTVRVEAAKIIGITYYQPEWIENDPEKVMYLILDTKDERGANHVSPIYAGQLKGHDLEAGCYLLIHPDGSRSIMASARFEQEYKAETN